jgi:hypothetical protein
MRFFFYDDDARVNFFFSFVRCCARKVFFSKLLSELTASVCPFSVDDDDDESEKKERESVGGAQIIALLQMLPLTKQEGRARVDSFLSTQKKKNRAINLRPLSLSGAGRRYDDWL